MVTSSETRPKPDVVFQLTNLVEHTIGESRCSAEGLHTAGSTSSNGQRTKERAICRSGRQNYSAEPMWSRECLRQLGSNLASIKTEIAKDGMAQHIARFAGGK